MKFSDQEILELLMTSEFNEGLTQEEAKFLLLKSRYFYRLLFARFENKYALIFDLICLICYI